jgi:hypothetical protein
MPPGLNDLSLNRLFLSSRLVALLGSLTFAAALSQCSSAGHDLRVPWHWHPPVPYKSTA